MSDSSTVSAAHSPATDSRATDSSPGNSSPGNSSPGDESSPQFATTRRVEFCDTDMAGIAHFANFFRWMEQAEHDYFRSLDLPVMTAPQDDTEASDDSAGGEGLAPAAPPQKVVVGWPRVSAQCTYERPAYRDDVLQIGLNVERIGVKSLTFVITFHVERENTRVRLARGRMKTACCKCRPDGSLESVAIPEHYLAKVEEAPRDE